MKERAKQHKSTLGPHQHAGGVQQRQLRPGFRPPMLPAYRFFVPGAFVHCSVSQGIGWFWLFYCYIFSQNAGWNMWESARHCIYLDILIDGKISRHNWCALNINLSWHDVTLSKAVVNKMVHSTKEKEKFIHNFLERGCHQDAGLHPLNGSPSLHPSPALIDHPPLTTMTTLHSQLCTHWQHDSIAGIRE